MAVANRTCVSFCNQPKAHFGLPGTIALNFTWMKRGFNACQTQCSMYPSIFNCFPVIQPISSKVCHFSTFFAHFGLLGYAPGTIAVNVTWMKKRIQCWSNAQQHIPIYLQLFTSYSEILVGNCNFSYPQAFNAPIVGVHIGIPGKSLVLRKLESWGYQAMKIV